MEEIICRVHHYIVHHLSSASSVFTSCMRQVSLEMGMRINLQVMVALNLVLTCQIKTETSIGN